MDAPLAAHGQRQQEVEQAGADQDLQSVRRPLGLLVQHEGHEGLDTATEENRINSLVSTLGYACKWTKAQD